MYRRLPQTLFSFLRPSGEQLSPEAQRQVQFHRLLTLLGAVLAPLFGLLYEHANPAAVDPAWARLLVAGLFAALFVASYGSGLVRRHYVRGTWAVLYVTMGWFAALAALNHYAPDYAVGFLLVFSVLTAAVGLGAGSIRPVLWFAGFGFFLAVGGTALSPAPGTNPLIVLAGVGTVAIAELTVIQGRLSTWNELRRRQEQLATAQQIAGLGSWERDFGTDELYWSAETRRIFGWDPEERVTYERFMETVHPGDRKALRRQQERLLEDGVPIDIEYRIVRPDGEERIVRERGTAEFDEDGDPIHALGTVLDVTEEREREKVLREERDRRAALFENASDPVMEVQFEDRTPTIRDVNPAFEKVFGLEAQEAADRSVPEAIVPESRREKHKRIRDRVLRGGRVETEVRRETSEGIREFLLQVIPMDREGASKEAYAWLTDITERKEREEKLRRTTARLSALYEHSPDMINVHDPEGTIIDPNPRFLERTGYDRDELEGMKVWELDQKIAADEAKALWESMETGDRRELEGAYRRKDGSVFPVEVRVRKLDLEGEDRFMAISRDITRRKERETELREAQERMELALKHTGSVIYEIDLETREVTRHGVFEDFFNASPEELPTWDVFAEHAAHPEDREKFFEFYRRLEEGKQESGTLEYRTSPETGEVRWIRDVVFVEDGPDRRLRGLAQDVTEQKERTQKLRRAKKEAEEAETLFETIFENVPVMIEILDFETGYRRVNDHLEEVLGWTSEELREHPNTTELLYNTQEEVRRAQKLVKEAPEGWHELQPRAKSGEPVDTLWTIAEAPKDRRLAIGLDITERKQWERALERAKEEAEEASRLKSAVMANMSHEIRTPLTSIIGFAELLKGQVEGEAAGFAERIRQGGERLMKTLDSVLELSRLEAGTEDLSREEVSLRGVARETIDILRPSAEEKHIALETDLPEGPVKGHWNEGALNRIVENLIENAIKFTPEGGRVEVHARVEDSGAILEVEDTGIGISEEAQEEIFETFKQESEGLGRDYEGTGLGLSIARRLTEAHGGSLEVESKKGEGSLFTVRLPTGNGGDGDK